jgi:hypothetical protein
MERTQLFDLMGELKLYGMKAAFDEIMATAIKRQHEPQRIVGDLLNAEINEKQARSIMRVNALSLIDDVEQACKPVLDGEQFNRLKDRDGTKMSDAHLRKKLAENHPWISKVYEQASNFVHLSGKHFEVSIARNDGDTRMAYLQISGHDPNRPEETYFEAVDAFFEATKLAGMLFLAFWVISPKRSWPR